MFSILSWPLELSIFIFSNYTSYILLWTPYKHALLRMNRGVLAEG
jgi:hypothetical protein